MKSLLYVGLAGVLGVVSASNAALVIHNSDIVGDHYVYDLPYEDIGWGILNNDASSSTGIGYWNDGNDSVRYFYAYGEGTATVVFTYDFSTTDYRPTAVSFRDIIQNLGGDSSVQGLSQWSTDGTTWHDLTSIAGANSGVGATYNITFDTGSPDVVYYRVTLSSDSGFGDSAAVQWGRQAPGQTWGYKADFTVTEVPEPAALGLLGLGSLLLAGHRRR